MWCAKIWHTTFHMLKNNSFAWSISPNSPHGRTCCTPYTPKYMVVYPIFCIMVFSLLSVSCHCSHKFLGTNKVPQYCPFTIIIIATIIVAHSLLPGITMISRSTKRPVHIENPDWLYCSVKNQCIIREAVLWGAIFLQLWVVWLLLQIDPLEVSVSPWKFQQHGPRRLKRNSSLSGNFHPMSPKLLLYLCTFYHSPIPNWTKKSWKATDLKENSPLLMKVLTEQQVKIKNQVSWNHCCSHHCRLYP